MNLERAFCSALLASLSLFTGVTSAQAADSAGNAPASGAADEVKVTASSVPATPAPAAPKHARRTFSEWNNTTLPAHDFTVYGLVTLGNVMLTTHSNEGTLGTSGGGEVRLKNRIGLGGDYGHGSGVFGPSGTLISPYTYFDLRPENANWRLQPFVMAGPGLVHSDRGNEAFTLHAGLGARLQLCKTLGIRADFRVHQPLETLSYGDYSFAPSEVRLLQIHLGLYASW